MWANDERDDGKQLVNLHSGKGVTKAQISRAAIATCLAAMLVLLCVVTGPAFADEGGQLPNEPYLATGAEEVADVGSLVNLEAAEELPHRKLDREGASELVEGVFGPVLESAVGPFNDLQVDRFISNNVAVITPTQPNAGGEDLSEEERIDSAGPRLLDSTLPLRTENDQGQFQEVDLGLEHDQGELQPANPLVDVGIPNELGEGVKLPEMGISIGVDGAQEQVSPSIVGESVALYPNISEDTDFAVAPTPTGVETLTTIRSPQSPREQTYTFKLPEGAELRLLKGDGGAEITQGDEPRVQIPPATAIDAAGASVKTTLGVSSGALTVSVEPAEDTAYPILVDPLFQSYEWKSQNSTTGINYNKEEEEWRQAEGLQINTLLPNNEWYLHKQVPTANYPVQSGWRGLYVHGLGELKAGDHFGYMYGVPRLYSDQKTYGTLPESYISRMELSNVVWVARSTGMSPYAMIGLYDPASGYVSFYKHDGLNGDTVSDMAHIYPFANPGDTSVRTAFVGFDSYENVNAINALFVGSASLQLSEPAGNIPGLTVKGVVPWTNGKAPLEFTATDSGLGVYSVTAVDEKNAAHSWSATYGCTGIPGNACPHTWKSTDAGHPGPYYDPAVLPDGEDFLKVTAQDPLGNVSVPASVLVKIDRVSPTLALSGPITEQASLGTARSIYEVEINSKDGTVEKPQAGVAKTVIEVDGKVVNESAPGCTTQNCSVSRKWPLESSQYSTGAHVLKVVSTDAAGNAVTKSQNFNLQAAAPPSVALSGTATQQATLGTSRPRYALSVNASTEAGFSGMPFSQPTYASSFGATGSANGQFTGAMGTAVDSKGNLWMVDQGNGRVEEFNAKGEYLSKFGEPGPNPGQLKSPSAVAIDASGNFWVANSDSRIEEFNFEGKFVRQWGKEGTADGYMTYPVDIAIDSKSNLWIVDNGNNRVQEFSPEGKFITKFGGLGTAGGQLRNPWGIAIGLGGNIWVADTWNNRLEKFDSTGKYLGEFGEQGTGNGNFWWPTGIRTDAAGDLYVTEGESNRVQIFNSGVEYLTQFGTKGTSPGQFTYPSYISVDSAGNIYVHDSYNRIQKWRAPVPPPTFSLSFGSKGTGAGQLTTPLGSDTDSAGNLWVVDRGNNRIEKFNAKGEFQIQTGATGSGAGQLSSPWGLVVDSSNNVWVTDTGNTRVVEFNSKGEFVATFGTNVNKTKVEAAGSAAEKNLCTAASKNVCQAGTAGSAEGQMKVPTGITASPGGNLFVAERANGRVEKFSPTGELLANFGKPGSAPGQLMEPTGVAMSPDGNYLWVTDAYTSRLQEWSATYTFMGVIAQEGSAGGQLLEPFGVSTDAKGNVWVADTGWNRIQEFSPAGDFMTKFGKFGSGEGQFNGAYSIAPDATGSLWITDMGHNQIQKWIPPTSRASTVTSELTVDGKAAGTKVGRCGAEACAVTSELLLENPAYLGKHTVQVKATDGLGRSTTKTVAVELQKDEAKPTLEMTGALATAPEGWVEQQTYNLNATATDAGYGVTSLVAKIDGKEVASSTSACPEGGCKATISKVIDMSAYAGGSHPAEVVSTDGAGNVSKKIWTINVDPEGVVSTKEVEATLEAVESTSPANPIGPSEEEAEYAGTAAGLSMKSGTGGTIVPVGTRVPTIVPGKVTEPMTMEIPQAEATSEPCQVDYLDPDEEAKAYGGKDETGEIKEEEGKAFSEMPVKITPTCKSSEEAEEKEETSEKAGNPAADGMATIALEPTSTAAQAGGTTLIGSTAAATPNTETHVDTVTRPLYDGVLTFQSIRDEAATQQFQWEVDLDGGLILKLIDSQHAQVYYPGGHPAFTITAEAAHDAIGRAVPTSLSVGPGNVVKLTVNHRGKGYVYPVLCGTGWEGGFTSVEVQGPKDERELREEDERIAQELRELREEEEEREPGEVEESAVSTLGLHTIALISTAGPPTPVAEASGPDTDWHQFTFAHKFKFNLCDYGVGSPAVPEPRIALFEWLRSRPTKCREWVGEIKLDAGMAVHGWYRSNQKINKIWIKAGNFHCDKWGRSQPALANCVKRPEGPVATPGEIHLLGDYRFPPGNNYSATAGPYATFPACVTVRGSIEMLQVHKEEPVISQARVKEKCDWP